MNCNLTPRKAFTLIELLIVVAIIGILAAIAVPNFLNAQTRAKIARAEADMRSLRTAIQSYQIDSNHYPPGRRQPDPVSLRDRLSLITTPIAYIAAIPADPFWNEFSILSPEFYDTYDYLDAASPAVHDGRELGELSRGYSYRLASAGPDNVMRAGVIHYAAEGHIGIDYHSSNGLVSMGDIVTVGGSIVNGRWVVTYPLGQYPRN